MRRYEQAYRHVAYLSPCGPCHAVSPHPAGIPSRGIILPAAVVPTESFSSRAGGQLIGGRGTPLLAGPSAAWAACGRQDWALEFVRQSGAAALRGRVELCPDLSLDFQVGGHKCGRSEF
jgi:hypothetical protein